MLLFVRITVCFKTGREGNILLYELCEKHNIGYRKIGKLIVAVDDTEVDALEKLYEEGKEDGANLVMLSQGALTQLEPNVRGVAAILSPSTGIIDSHSLMRYFSGKATDNGAQIVYKTEVVGIDRVSGGYKVKVGEPSGSFSFTTRLVIN